MYSLAGSDPVKKNLPHLHCLYTATLALSLAYTLFSVLRSFEAIYISFAMYFPSVKLNQDE